MQATVTGEDRLEFRDFYKTVVEKARNILEVDETGGSGIRHKMSAVDCRAILRKIFVKVVQIQKKEMPTLEDQANVDELHAAPTISWSFFVSFVTAESSTSNKKDSEV